MLKKIEAIQRVYLQHKKDGVTSIGIFRVYIKEQFYINKRTFYRYLEVNVNREMRRIKDSKKAVPEKVAVKKAAAKKGSAKKVVAKKPAPKKLVPKKIAANKKTAPIAKKSAKKAAKKKR